MESGARFIMFQWWALVCSLLIYMTVILLWACIAGEANFLLWLPFVFPYMLAGPITWLISKKKPFERCVLHYLLVSNVLLLLWVIVQPVSGVVHASAFAFIQLFASTTAIVSVPITILLAWLVWRKRKK